MSSQRGQAIGHPGQDRRSRTQTCWLLGEMVLVIILFVAGMWIFGEVAGRTRIHGDESRYIWRARYFDYFFVQHDVGRSEWGDNHWTHTQPMLANYLVGGWLWARGYDLHRSMANYDWSKSWWTNLRLGQVPDAKLLADARAPMVVLAAGTIGVLYGLGRVLGGPVAGLAAATLTLGSPLTREHLVLATSEAPFVFLLLLALLLGLLGAQRGRGGLPIGWAAAVGVTLGLSLEAKLTAALSLVAVLGWMVLVAGAAFWRHRSARLGTRLGRVWAVARGWLAALTIAVGVFVVSNPHLYPNPLVHTTHLFQRRAREMREQQQRHPENAVPNTLERPRRVLGGSLIDGTLTGSHGIPFEAALAPLGASLLLARAWRGRRQVEQQAPVALVLLTVFAYFGGVSAGFSLAHSRYLVPTLLLGSLLSGLGTSLLVARVTESQDLLRRHRLRIRAAVPSARP